MCIFEFTNIITELALIVYVTSTTIYILMFELLIELNMVGTIQSINLETLFSLQSALYLISLDVAAI